MTERIANAFCVCKPCPERAVRAAEPCASSSRPFICPDCAATPSACTPLHPWAAPLEGLVRESLLVALGAVPGAWLRFWIVNHLEPLLPWRHWGTFGVNMVE